jgi:hypothetical protein
MDTRFVIYFVLGTVLLIVTGIAAPAFPGSMDVPIAVALIGLLALICFALIRSTLNASVDHQTLEREKRLEKRLSLLGAGVLIFVCAPFTILARFLIVSSAPDWMVIAAAVCAAASVAVGGAFIGPALISWWVRFWMARFRGP